MCWSGSGSATYGSADHPAAPVKLGDTTAQLPEFRAVDLPAIGGVSRLRNGDTPNLPVGFNIPSISLPTGTALGGATLAGPAVKYPLGGVFQKNPFMPKIGG